MTYGRRDMRADARADANRAARITTNVPTSSAEIDAAMQRVIRECLDDMRPIEVQDFRMALVPEQEIAPRFQRNLAAVKQQRSRR